MNIMNPEDRKWYIFAFALCLGGGIIMVIFGGINVENVKYTRSLPSGNCMTTHGEYLSFKSGAKMQNVSLISNEINSTIVLLFPPPGYSNSGSPDLELWKYQINGCKCEIEGITTCPVNCVYDINRKIAFTKNTIADYSTGVIMIVIGSLVMIGSLLSLCCC